MEWAEIENDIRDLSINNSNENNDKEDGMEHLSDEDNSEIRTEKTTAFPFTGNSGIDLSDIEKSAYRLFFAVCFRRFNKSFGGSDKPISTQIITG